MILAALPANRILINPEICFLSVELKAGTAYRFGQKQEYAGY